MNKKHKVLVLDDLLPDIQHALLCSNYEVYTGNMEVALSWVSSGPDAPAAIVGEFYSQSEAVEFIKQVRQCNYRGLIYIIVDASIIDAPFMESCIKAGSNGVIDKASDPILFSCVVTKDIANLYNPIFLPLSLN